ncbi:MAG TPA: glycosyltransferase family 9 protein [Chloroflexia bacterium]|nr:glycosyltransferase family 9 protein [Chloroflexia bacterium]
MSDLRARAIGGAARLVGSPWRMAARRGQVLRPTNPNLKRVVVIKPCCMGDVLMATPAIAALRRALPDSHIALAVGGWSRQAVAHNPRLNALIDAPTGSEGTRWADYMKLARLIRRGRYGATVVLDRSPMLSIVALMSRARVRAGLDSDGRGISLTHPVPCPSDKVRHEVEWYLDVVRAMGLPAPREEAFLEFYPTDADRNEAAQLLAEKGAGEAENGYVAIHVGGGANPGMRLLSKRWDPERWARIADWLAETHDTTILLLGGPGKEDREAADKMQAALFDATKPYVVDLVGKMNWGTMGALIGWCDLFLGHDTGAMHLATAMRTPVVAVFGPSDPARYGPWDPSRHSVAVAPRPNTIPTGAEALRQAAHAGGGKYHTAVSVEGVWAAVEKMYTRAQREKAVDRA